MECCGYLYSIVILYSGNAVSSSRWSACWCYVKWKTIMIIVSAIRITRFTFTLILYSCIWVKINTSQTIESYDEQLGNPLEGVMGDSWGDQINRLLRFALQDKSSIHYLIFYVETTWVIQTWVQKRWLPFVKVRPLFSDFKSILFHGLVVHLSLFKK